MEHRLAAIVCADIANDDRATGDGDDAALGALARFGKAVTSRGGRMNETGNGSVLAAFARPLDAVECAVAAQRDLAAREPVSTEAGERQIAIGIEFGNVVVDGDVISGTGADVAAGLQALAGPGGIYISGRVLGQVQYRVDVGFTYQGNYALEGSDKRVRAFSVRLDPADAGKVTGLGDRKSLWPWVAAGTVLCLLIMGAAHFLWPS